MYKRWHLIGLEVGMSVASIGLRKEPTGCPIGFHADVIATAKRDLKPGEMLDGEGGYTVYGKLFPAEKSTGLGSLPLGLAHNVKLLKPDQGRPVADLRRRGDGRDADRGEAPPRDGTGLRAGRREDRGAIDRRTPPFRAGSCGARDLLVRI